MDKSKRNILGAVAYITWLGFIIAIAMGDRTDRFMAHHLNQALVISLVGLVGGFLAVIPILGTIAAGLINIVVVVFDIMGALSAYRGSTRPLPFIGDIHLIG